MATAATWKEEEAEGWRKYDGGGSGGGNDG